MDKVILWGTGGLSESVFLLNEQCHLFDIVAISANREYCNTDQFLGLPLIPNDMLETVFPPETVKLLVCLGFKEMNEMRKRISLDLQQRGYQFCNFIHPTAIVSHTLDIGTNNIILEGVLIGTKCRIGDGNIIMGGSLLSHDINIENYCYISLGVVFGGFVTVSNNCFVGLNSTLLPRLNLGEKTLIGAGTVIAKNTDPYSAYSSPRSILLDKKSNDIY